MKYILLWIQGCFELLLIKPIAWVIFAPYYEAKAMNDIRRQLKEKNHKPNYKNIYCGVDDNATEDAK